jgi:hypothetical protein
VLEILLLCSHEPIVDLEKRTVCLVAFCGYNGDKSFIYSFTKCYYLDALL